MADEEVEEPVPKRKVLIQAVSGYIGSNLAKRFAADGFEVLGTLKSPADPKPLAVSSVVEPTATALAAAFRSCELIVLDCLGDCEAAEALLVAASTEPIESAKVLVGVSSVMTWARTSPNSEEPEQALTEGEYKRRRPHSSYKDLVSLEKLVTKSAREGLRTHVVAAGLTYGAEEDLFHPLFKAAGIIPGRNQRSCKSSCRKGEGEKQGSVVHQRKGQLWCFTRFRAGRELRFQELHAHCVGDSDFVPVVLEGAIVPDPEDRNVA